MSKLPKRASIALLSALTLTACADKPPPEPLTKIVYPAMPDTKCPRKPELPALADDVALAKYLKAKDDAGDACRDRLDAVDAVVRKWPRQP